MLPEEPVITVLFWAMEYFRCIFLLFLTRSRHLKPISFPLGQLVASGLPPVNASLSLLILNKSLELQMEISLKRMCFYCHFLAKITIWKILTRLIDRAHTALKTEGMLKKIILGPNPVLGFRGKTWVQLRAHTLWFAREVKHFSEQVNWILCLS